jgi:biopolymer transport protein ExbB
MENKLKIQLFKILLFTAILICISAFIGTLVFVPQSSENSYYNHFIVAGGAIVWFLLIPMSLIVVYIAIDLAVSIRRKKIVPDGIVSDLSSIIRSSPEQKWLIEVNRNSDFISNAVIKTMNQTHAPSSEIERLLIENIEQQALKVLRKIEWANIIGNVAPMIGLFGTVYGMIEAFNQIVIAGGQPQPAQLAGGISVALVTTYWGLIVAIPALAVAGLFRNHLEALTSQAITDSESLIPLLRQSLKNEKDYIRKLAVNRDGAINA